VLCLTTKVVPHFLVGNNVLENGDIAVHPRFIDGYMFVFACRLDIDRGATLASGIGAVDGEGALAAGLAFHARARLPPPLLIFCSDRVLLPLCLETHRTLTINGPRCAYPTLPLFWHTALDDLKAGGVAPAGAVIAGY
jgi:hypothetical protein